MGANTFGHLFRMTTFGESHGKGVGVVIDGCPPGLTLSEQEIQAALAERKPGSSPYTSPRQEEDNPVILSGLFEGKTTGAPLTIWVENQERRSHTYVENLYRPGHANFTYLAKYGIFDFRGGGRASARETVARVAAGFIAKKLLQKVGIECVAFLQQVGNAAMDFPSFQGLRDKKTASRLFCPCDKTESEMIAILDTVMQEKDSIGGVVGCMAKVHLGLGDPIYRKIEAELASAMLSIPASKGFEIGEGFAAATQRGSCHNDRFAAKEEEVYLETNRSGGTLGGITTGSLLQFRVAFKPTSSIGKKQSTLTLDGKEAFLEPHENAAHDPCVAIRAVPVVEAMTALVLIDAFLMQSTMKTFSFQCS